jgi:preprotein translocase subunit SecB
MQHPPLQLKQYFYTETSLKANPTYRSGSPKAELGFNLQTEVSLAENASKPDEFQLSLTVTTLPKEGAVTPYEVKITAVGIFTVQPEYPDREGLVRITGSSILYSALREYLLTLTGRGPWKALVLPTMSFNDLKQVPEVAATERAKPKVRQNKP